MIGLAYGPPSMPSRTFVLHVDPLGHSTVEDVRTGRRVALTCLTEVADQITRWLEESLSRRSSNGVAGDDPEMEA